MRIFLHSKPAFVEEMILETVSTSYEDVRYLALIRKVSKGGKKEKSEQCQKKKDSRRISVF
jgi:hypothetical protein